NFGRHPDAEIYLSQPGLGTVLGARVLAEFGDDPYRYQDHKARRNYAGTSPITRTSGRKTAVLARYARNRRLGDAVHQWAFCALSASPGARAYDNQLRARAANHHAALRHLGNRLVGILHGCQNPNPLRRDHRLGPPSALRCLTSQAMGCLSRALSAEVLESGRAVRRAQPSVTSGAPGRSPWGRPAGGLSWDVRQTPQDDGRRSR
ncbi:MAG: transposase, partial [Actinomycetospora sp.]|nr:transposase [Actinomycetospora sp.]